MNKRKGILKKLSLIVLASVVVALAALAVIDIQIRNIAFSKPYPLNTCVVSDYPLRKPFTDIYKGKKVVFCCRNCRKRFDKNPSEYMAKIEQARRGFSVQPNVGED